MALRHVLMVCQWPGQLLLLRLLRLLRLQIDCNFIKDHQQEQPSWDSVCLCLIYVETIIALADKMMQCSRRDHIQHHDSSVRPLQLAGMVSHDFPDSGDPINWSQTSG